MAITGALTLPDIAAVLDGRTGGSAERYAGWFNDYLRDTFTSHDSFADGQFVLLSGRDCYALRCAFLHAGDFDITGQNKREALEKFHFWAPHPGLGVTVHCNLHNNNTLLQLQVNCFCEEICLGIEAWMQIRGSDLAVAIAIADMPRIQLPHEPQS